MKKLALLVGLLAAFGTVEAQRLTVPSEFPTIQSAINAAAAGDTVLVEPGVYFENLIFRGRAITVGSRFMLEPDTTLIDATIIDGSRPADVNRASVVTFDAGEDSLTSLTGLTIRGGTGSLVEGGAIRAGGGILSIDSSPRLTHLEIIRNQISANVAAGGGIAVLGNTPTPIILDRVQVRDNHIISNSEGFGGGIATTVSITIRQSVVANNDVVSNGEATAGGIGLDGHDNPSAKLTLTRSLIAGNAVLGRGSRPVGGGGLAVVAAGLKLVSSEISYNDVAVGNVGGGGGLLVLDTNERPLEIRLSRFLFNTCGDGPCFGGGLFFSGVSDFRLDATRIAQNAASDGGGIGFDESQGIVRRSTIDKNKAVRSGGGVWIDIRFLAAPAATTRRQSLAQFADRRRTNAAVSNSTATRSAVQDRLMLTNNTIAENSVVGALGGGGVYTLHGSPRIENSIIWDNEALPGSSIEGGAAVRYSIIAGGYDGFGNLSVDPILDASLRPDPNRSPAIDAGNPDPSFNDQEDPDRPGFARIPAFGTVRNDIGATGGPPDPLSEPAYLRDEFSDFLNRLDAAAEVDRAAVVDAFIAARGGAPIVFEDGVVYFLYRGSADRVNVVGDFNDWNPNAFPMTFREVGRFWFREEVFESNARLDYKFVVNGSQFILDPLNNSLVSGGFGPNSQLTMPAYRAQWEIEDTPGTIEGTTTAISVESSNLAGTRDVTVYLPAGYANSTERYPAVYYQDGLEYLRLGRAKTVLDNLIAEDHIQPVIAVFVPPGDRLNEYGLEQRFLYEQFFVDELVSAIDSLFRTRRDPSQRIVTGPSAGALISAQICYNRPQVFGKCALVSPAFQVNDQKVLDTILSGPVRPIQWYVDWGIYEPQIAENAARFRTEMRAKGYEVAWNVWNEGHSWGNWRAHMDHFLEFWFTGPAVVSNEAYPPAADRLAENPQSVMIYPNPVPMGSPLTLEFDVSFEGRVVVELFDTLGRKVELLLDKKLKPGRHRSDLQPATVNPGTYFLRLRTASGSSTKPLSVVR